MATITCTRTDVEDLYGVANVEKWADLDGDEDPTKIAARIAKAIAVAAAEVEDRLRGGPYAIPLASNGDSCYTLVNAIAELAGLWLHENRRLADVEDEDEATAMPRRRKRVHRLLAEVRAGKIQLDLATVGTQPSAPFVVQ